MRYPGFTIAARSEVGLISKYTSAAYSSVRDRVRDMIRDRDKIHEEREEHRTFA